MRIEPVFKNIKEALSPIFGGIVLSGVRTVNWTVVRLGNNKAKENL